MKSLVRRLVLGASLLGQLALAQQFRLVVTQGGNTSVIQNGGTLTFDAHVGESIGARVTATYIGTGQVTIGQLPSLIGSTAFSVKLSNPTPLVLTAGGTFSMDIQYTAPNAALNSAELNLGFVETPAGGTSSNIGSISLSLQGTGPSFGLSYVLQTDQNVVPLNPGDSVVFPPTQVGSTAQAGLNVTNLGTGAGSVTGISIISGGSAFKLSRLPLFPQVVGAAQNLQVLILYQPLGVAQDTGQVQITYDSGPPTVVGLTGSGASPAFVYQLIQSNPPQTVTPGGVVTLPPVTVGQTSTVLVQVTNAGNLPGVINAINVAGPGFQLSSPPLLPQTLAPNSSLSFALSFTPSVTGTLTGVLLVNSDRFNLSGVGLGSQLTFSYDLAGVTVTLDAANSSVVFGPVVISRSAQILLNIKNTGTLTATIANIGVGQANGPFTTPTLPNLPLSLAPGEQFQLPIIFRPTTLGFANGTLRFDSTTVPLIGSGTQPPPLPAYTITGPSGNPVPGPAAVSLTLSEPYPVAIAGVLNLGVSTSLPLDPAAQFATGGSNVSFLIPANSTSAVFGAQGTQIGLQTGTVASTITLTPSFTTQAGSVDLTPASPTTLQLRIAPAAPVLLAAQVTSQSSTGFTLTVSGYTTTRTLTAMNVELTPVAGINLSNTKFTIDLQQISAVWFRSTASQAFGGQFTISIPFTLQGNSGSAILASVTTTLANEIGTSNAIVTKGQ